MLRGRLRSSAGVALIVVWPAAAAASDARAGRAQEEREEREERTLIVGAGGAAEVELADGSAHAGANVFVEWEAIEGWLELELGASVLPAGDAAEVPVDLLFKKPFRLAPGIELMAGLGPEVVTVTGGAARGTYAGGEVALDFMFWPWRRAGLWIEPAYDFVFRDGVAHSLGSTGGVMLGW
jgi:hypothetical protein